MAAITKRWRKWMAVSCTHGHLADPKATGAMLKFREAYKPATVLHLGDFTDMAALRAGARRDSDDPDHAESMADDLLAGLSFLRELQPTVIHLGNHEDRLCSLAHSGSAVVSYAAGQVLGRIEDAAKEMKAKIVSYDGLRASACTQLGDTLFLHGVIFSQSAARDHAETLGMNCVFGHTHRVAQEAGRCQRPVIGYNIGCGVDLNVGYAKNRRATSAWAHGFAYGEYCDTACTVNLVTLSPHYRLPL
jgi:predicted phosphodiesterase